MDRPNYTAVYIRKVQELFYSKGYKEIVELVEKIRKEREYILNNIWTDKFSFDEYENIIRFREMDFYLLFYNAVEKIPRDDLSTLLLDTLNISINLSEYEKSAFICSYILKKLLSKYSQKQIYDIYYNYYKSHILMNVLNKAEKAIKKCIQISANINNIDLILKAKNGLAILYLEKGEIDKGEAILDDIVNQLDKAKDDVIKANIIMNRGIALHIKGDWNGALEKFKESYTIMKNLENDSVHFGLLLYNMAIAYYSLNDVKQAEELLIRSIKIAETEMNKNLKALAYSLYSEILLSKKLYKEAIATATTSFTIFSQIKNKANIADVYRVLGIIKREEGDYDMSLSFLNTSSRINEDCKKFFNLAETYVELAKLYKLIGEKKKSLHYANLAKRYYQKIGATKRIETLEKI